MQWLYLYTNQISDLSPLAELTNLQVLRLYNNQISNLNPLEWLTNLQFLYIDNNQINDLSPLAGLTNLQKLWLNNNQICDLSPLVDLTNLQELELENNPISYESMLLSQSWSLPCSTNEYNPLSPCYPVPNRNANNVLVNYPLSWQGNYNDSQDVFYEVWLGISPDSLVYQGFETQMVNITQHLYSFTPMLEPLTQYYWRIRAIAPSDTIWSGMWSFTTGEEFYQPIISVAPTNIYDELTTAETSQIAITIANNGTSPLIWNGNIVLTRAEQKTGTNVYLTKENNIERELHPKIENTAENSIRYKDMDREGTSQMPEINLSPSFGTIEPNSSVICILNFIPGDSLGTYNYELQLSSNDPISPLITVPVEYVVTSPIAYIPDDNFRMAINEALGQPSDYQPTITDLNGLTGALYAIRRNISSIEGAQYLINLQHLDIAYNQISDISPLAGLTILQYLWLNDNQISDLSSLAGLTNLQSLWLFNNQISDISPLAGLTNLKYLWIINNQIIDLSPLAGLTNLQELALSSNRISDLSPLADLFNLRQLGLYDNQISDISPLAGLTNLQGLAIYNNQISNISPLAGLTNMQGMHLDGNQIIDLSPLAGLSNLQYLNLQQNHISDLSPLMGLTNLEQLYLGSNQIIDLSPLAGLTNLLYLDLANNQISDLNTLAGLSNLQALALDNNHISDISPLAGLYNLWSLELDNNPISYESMLLSQNWFLPGYSSTYNPLSPCYPVPNRNAVNVSIGSDLSWQGNYDNSQDVFYEVWLGFSPYNLSYIGSGYNISGTQYLFNVALQSDTQYYWRVKAVSSTEEIWSGMWSFTTGNYEAGNMSMLEPVSVTLAINALQNQVRLSWQRRRDDESYYVYWSENPYAEFPEGWNGPVNVTETNYTDNLTDKCFYRVFAMPSIRGETENKQNTKPRAIMPGRGE